MILGSINTKSKEGVLIVSEKQLEIHTKRKLIQIKFDEIKEIGFDAGFPTEKDFKIVFKTKANQMIRLKMIDYSMVDDLTDTLKPLVIKNVKIVSDIDDPFASGY